MRNERRSPLLSGALTTSNYAGPLKTPPWKEHLPCYVSVAVCALLLCIIKPVNYILMEVMRSTADSIRSDPECNVIHVCILIRVCKSS